METLQEQSLQVASLKEEWELIYDDQTEADEKTDEKPKISSMAVSQASKREASKAEARATRTIYPQSKHKCYVESNALSLSVDA